MKEAVDTAASAVVEFGTNGERFQSVKSCEFMTCHAGLTNSTLPCFRHSVSVV